ncbi:MAG: 1,4-dihydroxy-6-naphthoate synthase [Bacteroidota bacterium]
MELSLGFSPCPNDTFIFDALIHQKIDTEGLEFKVTFDDVETLNQKALNSELDITKLSFHAYAYVSDNYVLLDSGSALGFGVGPLLICKDKKFTDEKSLQTSNLNVGVPGKLTTANLLLGIAYPQLLNKKEMLFSNIEAELQNGTIDLGLIIHENRFTYEDRGLYKIVDLGSYWENLTGFPIPLGGIVIKNSLTSDVKNKVNRLVRKSVEYAFRNPKSAIDFIKQYAQEMSEEVMYKHINLYVNKYSIDLGFEGKKAIKTLFDVAVKRNIIKPIRKEIFLKE